VRSGLEVECKPAWCREHCGQCGRDSACPNTRTCQEECPCLDNKLFNISLTCTTHRQMLEADLSSLLYLNSDIYSVYITLEVEILNSY